MCFVLTAAALLMWHSLWVALAAASWGTWSLFLRPAGLPASATGPVVFATMALCGLPLCLRLPRAYWKRRTVALLVGNSLCDAVNVLCFFAAMEQGHVAVAVLTHYLAPVLVALAAPWLGQRKIKAVVPAACVALLGLVLVLAPWQSSARPGMWRAALLGTASAFCYAGNVFFVGSLSAQIGAVRAMVYHSALAALVLLPFGVHTYAQLATPRIGWVIIAAAMIGAGSGIVFIRGLAHIGAAQAAVLTYMEPLVAVTLGAVVWREPLPASAALGMALVLGAGVYSVWPRKAPRTQIGAGTPDAG